MLGTVGCRKKLLGGGGSIKIEGGENKQDRRGGQKKRGGQTKRVRVSVRVRFFIDFI